MSRRTTSSDRGMTLIEMLVVISLIGFVVLVIAATFATILRVTPATTYRIDDARSTRGLQTWLVRDVASTPPAVYDPGQRVGYVDSSFASPAAAGVPAGDVCTTSGIHVLFMAWADGGTSYRSQYTIEGDAAGGFEVVRTLCGADSGARSLTGALSSATCASQPRSQLVVTDADADGALEAVVQLCFLSVEPDLGLFNPDDQQEITMSVVSRNGDT